jgi:hypothetical protein
MNPSPAGTNENKGKFSKLERGVKIERVLRPLL